MNLSTGMKSNHPLQDELPSEKVFYGQGLSQGRGPTCDSFISLQGIIGRERPLIKFPTTYPIKDEAREDLRSPMETVDSYQLSRPHRMQARCLMWSAWMSTRNVRLFTKLASVFVFRLPSAMG